MPAITATLATSTEFAGKKKLVTITTVPTTADDSFTLDASTHGITSLDSIVGAVLTGGADAALGTVQVTISDATNMIVQVKTFNAAGAAATDWTSAGVAIGLLGNV